MMKTTRGFSKSLYIWVRDLHLYFGLASSPFVLVFAVSTVLLNHGWSPGVAFETTTLPVQVKRPVENVDQAREVLNKLGISGEIRRARGFTQGNRVVIPVAKPGRKFTVKVDLTKQQAEIESQATGFLDSLIFLHTMPGPHRAGAPNWFFVRLWGWLADTVVGLILFLSLSGIYMWALLKAERPVGLVLLGAGCLSLLILVYGFFVV